MPSIEAVGAMDQFSQSVGELIDSHDEWEINSATSTTRREA